MKVFNTDINDVLLIKLDFYKDERGLFLKATKNKDILNLG